MAVLMVLLPAQALVGARCVLTTLSHPGRRLAATSASRASRGPTISSNVLPLPAQTVLPLPASACQETASAMSNTRVRGTYSCQLLIGRSLASRIRTLCSFKASTAACPAPNSSLTVDTAASKDD